MLCCIVTRVFEIKMNERRSREEEEEEEKEKRSSGYALNGVRFV